IKFIFATTEPDKVIGTIRSRTHHYPFRLVPPEPLMAYLELLCRQENVPVAPGVLSLVIRAGAGSVRDSLSVLDQLMAGAGQNGLDYELAVALLGYTHASLLDDVVEAVAASDAATVFRAVDRVIQTGHDPRRFVEDLLERFRDLIIVQAMPESAQTILRGMPADQIARLQNQAHNLGAAELSRAADVTNTALTEMTGATSPRLHLELLCARILLPSSEQTERGIAARIDRVERRLSYAGNDVGAPAPAGSSVSVAGAAPERNAPEPTAPAVVQPLAAAAPQTPVPAAPAADRAVEATPAAPASQEATPREQMQQPQQAEARQPLTAPRVSTSDWPVDEPAGGRTTAGAGVGPAADVRLAPAQDSPAPAQAAPVQEAPAAAPVPEVRTVAAPGPPAAPAAAAGPGGDVEVLRRAWPEILQTLSKIKRSTWALVEPNAQVAAFDGQGLTLAFSTSGLAGAFGRADHSENLRQAIHKTVGIDCQITAVAGGSNSGNNSPASSEPNPKAPASRVAPPTSADVAWGLAPAGPNPTQDTAAPLAAAAPAVQASTAHAPAVPAPTAPAPTAPASAPQFAGPAEAYKAPAPAPAQAAAPAPAQSSVQAPGPVPAASPVLEADTAGTYAYSDDDWGPPRDEDAPPLDEEPPMDWDPSASAEPRRTPAAPAAAPGSGGSDLPAGKRAPKTKKAGAAAGGITATAKAAPHDPWTRAVEQAPGVWVVGTETNIGKGQASSGPDSTSAAAAPAPHYEPATAQVPQAPEVPQVPAVPQPVAPQPAAAPASPESVDPWGLPVAEPVTAPSSSGPGDFGRPSAPESPAPEPVAAPVREYAMAASAPQSAPPQPSPATSPEAAAARQSLYQRLSNSPEAEAGRAKAPSRAAAAAVPDVQDIPSADDETIEESGVFGRAAIERILGGKLIEERSLDGSPLPPRY
ncbi:MAG TPA: DNA polymerase III subunit gamma and tau, partial [Arthrobacter sp.]